MSRDSLNINVFGEETYFNDDVTFFRNVKIGGNLDVDGTFLVGGFTISATASGGGSGILSDITVDYTGRSSPCTLPITVTEPSAGTKQINIPDNSNAFGTKYVQTTEPTGSSVCDGDIWYDTASGSGGSVGVLTGTIHMWGGSTGSIPSGYQLCDGSAASTSELQAITGSNVPDLRDRFIVGVGSGYAVGAQGGANNVTLTTAQMPQHDHLVYGQDNDAVATGNLSNEVANVANRDSANAYYSRTTSLSGSSTAHENRPPYYALVYMIKT